jgi:hypothetical protein
LSTGGRMPSQSYSISAPNGAATNSMPTTRPSGRRTGVELSANYSTGHRGLPLATPLLPGSLSPQNMRVLPALRHQDVPTRRLWSTFRTSTLPCLPYVLLHIVFVFERIAVIYSRPFGRSLGLVNPAIRINTPHVLWILTKCEAAYYSTKDSFLNHSPCICQRHYHDKIAQ